MWFMMRMYGAEGLRAYLRNRCGPSRPAGQPASRPRRGGRRLARAWRPWQASRVCLRVARTPFHCPHTLRGCVPCHAHTGAPRPSLLGTPCPCPSQAGVPARV